MKTDSESEYGVNRKRHPFYDLSAVRTSLGTIKAPVAAI